MVLTFNMFSRFQIVIPSFLVKILNNPCPNPNSQPEQKPKSQPRNSECGGGTKVDTKYRALVVVDI